MRDRYAQQGVPHPAQTHIARGRNRQRHRLLALMRKPVARPTADLLRKACRMSSVVSCQAIRLAVP